MSISWSWLASALGLMAARTAQQPPPPAPPTEERIARMKIAIEAMARIGASAEKIVPLRLYTTTTTDPSRIESVFKPAKPPPGVVPDGVRPMAMDEEGWGGEGFTTWSNTGGFSENLHWLGFPYLAELTQRPEYRAISEKTAREMTRKWIKLQAAGDEDKSDRIAALDGWLKKHEIREKFQRCAELDGFFGRSHLYIDTGAGDDRELLRSPLVFDKRIIKKGSVQNIKVIDPNWSYPGMYNSIDPLQRDFYVPKTWYVMGKEVSSSRFLTFVGREVPDLLKPAYSFGGLSMSQMAKPYIDNWLRTRQSVSDLVHSFSNMILLTDMGSLLGGTGEEEVLRAQIYNSMRDNFGLFMLDKTKEDLKNVSTPLGSLDKLQAQSQEQMSSVSSIPLIVLLGITPSGLNASEEGELQVWEQTVHGYQEHLFKNHLITILKLGQLDLFGDIDDGIVSDWEPLRELSEKDEQDTRKAAADTDAVYVGIGAVGPEEIRQKLANEPDSPYAGLDLSGPPPTPPEAEQDPLDDDPDGGGGGGGNPPGGSPGGGQQEPAAQALAGLTNKAVGRALGGDKGLAQDQDGPPVARLKFDGMTIGVETLKGQERVGRGWRCKMPADYGYIMRTEGMDGDRVDVFVGPLRPEQNAVFVIEQHKLGGTFDEHKVMLGFESVTEAIACYDRSFSDGSGTRRRRAVLQMRYKDLMPWLRRMNRVSKTAAEYSSDGSDDHCSACRNFRADSCCVKVIGDISPLGWCKFFGPIGPKIAADEDPGYEHWWAATSPQEPIQVELTLLPPLAPPGPMIPGEEPEAASVDPDAEAEDQSAWRCGCGNTERSKDESACRKCGKEFAEKK